MYELPVDLPQFPNGPLLVSVLHLAEQFLLGKFDPLIEGVLDLRFRMCCEEMAIDINTSTQPPSLVARPNPAQCGT